MSRYFRKSRNISSQYVQWFALATLGFLMRLVVFSGVFVYQVSPLRDSSFQPNSANAGSLIRWMQGIDEATWTRGAAVLAGLLTINLVFIFRQWIQSIVGLIAVGVLIFISLNWMFLIYLLEQWIID